MTPIRASGDARLRALRAIICKWQRGESEFARLSVADWIVTKIDELLAAAPEPQPAEPKRDGAMAKLDGRAMFAENHVGLGDADDLRDVIEAVNIDLRVLRDAVLLLAERIGGVK